MRRSTRHWIAAGSVLLFAALILIAYLAFVGIAYADPGPGGKRADGTAVSPVMPFAALKELNDTDLKALHLYLKSLSPRPVGGR